MDKLMSAAGASNVNKKTDTVELLPHNQMLYDKIVAEMEKGERSIFYSQATGLGKSFIFMRLVQDYFMDKKILYIVPKIAIWNNLINYSDFNKLNNDNIEMTTFASFNVYNKSLVNKYDVVFVDECHHMLSDIQGNNVGIFINDIVNKGGYAFGLTATPEYKGAFVDEIYFKVSCYGYDVFEAIEKGVFPKIKLALANINIDEVPEELKARYSIIGTKTLLERIIEEHSDANKWLVYFPTKQELNDAIRELKLLFPDFKVYKVYKEYGKDNESEIIEFSEYNGKALLLSVNMLLEGIHLPKVDGVLLYRNVVEFTTYMQIYGRLCNINTKSTPLFIDVSNAILNFRSKSIYSRNRGQIKKKYNPKDLFDITSKDYWTVELADLLEREHASFWTEEEDNILKERYPLIGLKVRDELIGRSDKAITTRAKRLGIRSNVVEVWTEAEDEIIRLHYQDMGCNIADILSNRSITAIQARASYLGIAKQLYWTDEEDEIIKTYYQSESDDELTLRLPNRTANAIVYRRIQLGCDRSKDWLEEEINLLTKLKEEGFSYKEIGEKLSSLDCNVSRNVVRTKNSVTGYITIHGLASKRTNTEWTEELDNYLINNYLKLPLPKLAEELGVSIYTVRKRIKHLGLVSNRVTEELKERVIKLYKEGYSKSEIAKLVDRPFTTVWNILDREQVDKGD